DFDRIHFELRSDARRFEEGSHNGLSIYGLGAAVDLLLEVDVARIARRLAELTSQLIEGLQALGMEVTNSLKPQHRSGIVTFRLPGDPEGQQLPRLERHLFAQGIYASVRRRSLRLSPHFYNTEEEIQRSLTAIKSYRQG